MQKFPELTDIDQFNIQCITARGDRSVHNENTFEVLNRLEAGPLGFIIRLNSEPDEEFKIKSSDLIGLS